MAEEDSKRSRFKSKWNKILKQKHDASEEAVSVLQEPSEYTLSSDVADFLKPSAEKTRPKLSIGVATRWPDATQVARSSTQGSGAQGNVNGWAKRRRREGLRVGFAVTEPEVIGCGGDEALEPTSEIGRAKARRRSASDARVLAAQVASYTRGTHSRPPPAQRAQTSVGELSPGLQKIRVNPATAPLVIAEQAASTENVDTSSVAVKQSAMRANEGMALRRASMVINLEEIEAHDQAGEPKTAQSFSLGRNTTASPQILLHESESPFSPAGPSPFADPKYVRRKSREVSPSVMNVRVVPVDENVPPPAQQYQPYKPSQSSMDVTRSPGPMLSSSSGRGTGLPPRGGPNDYFTVPHHTRTLTSRSPALTPQPRSTSRPSSIQSAHSITRLSPSPAPDSTALPDFAERISHMSGVFRLTAEKQKPAWQCSPTAWLRAALWWYIRGKTGLETMLNQRSELPHQTQLYERLEQAHVDLAKAWWILNEPLTEYSRAESPPAESSKPPSNLQPSCTALRAYFRSLTHSMSLNALLPPHQSLIQGQDTTIWLEESEISPNVLLGNGSTAPASPLDLLPLGDTRASLFQRRYNVAVSVQTPHSAATATALIPCVLSLLRNKSTSQYHLALASQSSDVSLTIGRNTAEGGNIAWTQVEWRHELRVLGLRLGDGVHVGVRLRERDYGSLCRALNVALR